MALWAMVTTVCLPPRADIQTDKHIATYKQIDNTSRPGNVGLTFQHFIVERKTIHILSIFMKDLLA